MALGPRLDIRQTQSLVMTPQLQHAIRLLALSNLEVESFIADELERNPLLETAAAADEAPIAADPEVSPSADDEAGPQAVDRVVQLGDAQRDRPLDVDYDGDDFHQGSRADGMGMTSERHGEDRIRERAAGDGPDLDSLAGGGPSLHEHLLAQASIVFRDGDLFIAGQIIALIEETGYVLVPLGDLARRLGIATSEVERVLLRIQQLDPPGVGARSLAECLALQARDADRLDPAMERLIANLDYLAKGNVSALKRICGVDDEDLKDMIQELRAYDPKPGCRFGWHDQSEAIVPDIFILSRGAGWAVELNNATLPRVLINRRYYAELSREAQDRASKAWLSECLTSANWLMKTLDQRARTIVKVATEIVKQQDGFFRMGVTHLRPLTLRTVADAIGMHESTVSRVTSNKYLSCDRGVFELKYFFTSGIQGSDGDTVSAETVKSHIRTMIAGEDAKHILSDDQLVAMLRAIGVDIARRTVAKYREAMGIGSSVQRRRQKAIGSHAA